MRLGPKPFAIAIVFLTLMTVATTLMLADDSTPSVRARTLGTTYSSSFNITVIDGDGRPIGPAPIGPANIKIFGNTTVPAGWMTDENGSALITGILGNSTGIAYSMTVEATGFQPSLDEVIAFDNMTTNVTVILVGGVILGKVSSSTTPTVGIAGATVNITSLGSSYSNKTDSQGRYRMQGIPEGRTYAVSANASGYVGASVLVGVPIVGSVDFVLTSRTGSISGFVYNSVTHLGMNGTNVSIRIGNSVTLVFSSSNGSYQFPGVPPGVYSVTATKDGFYSNTITGVNVTRENRTTLNINLTERPILLYGTVRSGTLLLVRANISLLNTTFSSVSGPDGTYEIMNLTAGIYNVSASRSGYETAVFHNVVIAPGEEKQLNVNLTAIPGAILRGVVSSIIDGNKTPLVDVKVTLVTTNFTQISTSTNIAGEFAFTGLNPGNYTLMFERADYRPMEVSGIAVTNDSMPLKQFLMTPLRHGFTGFIFGFDMPHSMMFLGLVLTIAILAVAVYLRIRTFQVPGNAPAVYDEEEDQRPEGESADGQSDLEDSLSESKAKGKNPE